MKGLPLARLRGLALLVPLQSLAAQTRDSSVAARVARIEQALEVVETDGTRRVAALRERMQAAATPAVSVAVLRNGQISWARAWGTLEAGGTQLADTGTVFQAASMSKPIAAIVALSLVDAGRLTLDGDITALVKDDWHARGPDSVAVTLRRLLNHTAEISPRGFLGYAADRTLPTTSQILSGTPPATSRRVVVDSAYANRFRYSGGGYTVVQLLVERSTGRSLAAEAEQRLFRPLGLTRTTFLQPLPDSWTNNAARSHRPDGSMMPHRWNSYPELAAAGLWTTPSDYARLLLAMRAAWHGEPGALLSRALAHEALTPGVGSWGLGFGARADGDDIQYQHGGSNIGYKSVAVAWVGRGDGVVVMTNGERGGQLRRELVRAIFTEYGWRQLPEM
jgi:CubicO group peptidase (beta-lactamase class C family)